MEALITNRIRILASRYAKRNSQIDTDDLTQIGLIAAWKAEKSWRDDRGANLTTWQQLHARSAMLNEIEKQRRHRGQVELKDEFAESGQPFNAVEVDFENINFSKRERQFIDLVCEGYSCKDAEELLELCHQRISQLKAGIRHKFETQSKDFLERISANSHN